MNRHELKITDMEGNHRTVEVADAEDTADAIRAVMQRIQSSYYDGDLEADNIAGIDVVGMTESDRELFTA